MAPPDDDQGYDPRRREFFRTFGRQSVRSAGAMIGAASELRRVGGDAARELLDMDQRPVYRAPPAPAAVPVGSAPFRSAYVVSDAGLALLDQRDLPATITTHTVREPSEIASAIRLGVVNAGPVLGEICAYGLALAIAGAAQRPRSGRDLVSRAAADTLRAARTDVRASAYAVARVMGAYDRAIARQEVDDPATLAASVRAEADAIATNNALDHAALGRAGASFLAADEHDEPIHLLMHGDMGPLSSGLVGPGTSIVQALVGLGRSVHVWLTEAAPGMEGSRIAALQLMQSDIPYTVIPDTAVAWLLSARRLEAALLRGDYVCANGDTGALIGSRSVSVVARSAGVPVYVVAPPSAIDLELRDGSTLVADIRSPAEAAAAALQTGDLPRSALFGSRLNPPSDMVPAALIDGYLTALGFSREARA